MLYILQTIVPWWDRSLHQIVLADMFMHFMAFEHFHDRPSWGSMNDKTAKKSSWICYILPAELASRDSLLKAEISFMVYLRVCSFSSVLLDIMKSWNGLSFQLIAVTCWQRSPMVIRMPSVNSKLDSGREGGAQQSTSIGLVLPLTHWGRVTHICVSGLSILGSDNGLSPGRRQAIIWTNAGIL